PPLARLPGLDQRGSIRPQGAPERYRVQVAATSTKTRRPSTGRSATGRTQNRSRPGPKPRARRSAVAVFGQLLARLWSGLGLVVGTLARAVGRNAATARELDQRTAGTVPAWRCWVPA